MKKFYLLARKFNLRVCMGIHANYRLQQNSDKKRLIYLFFAVVVVVVVVFFALDLPGKRGFNMDENRAPHCTGQGDEKGG